MCINKTALKPYIAIVHKDLGSAYGMTFPDAPGCFSAADDLDQLFEMANEALIGWIEVTLEYGDDLPPTRDLSEIKADPKWRESFADAVLVIAVPAPELTINRRAA